ncbi:MAG: transporter, ATP-binding protein [Caulobacteraceae bacterium]|nr:transporter, ATP-binding protein [Caulobacteraceae bacterium]
MAAPLLALKDVRLIDGPRPLFDGVDLSIEPRARAALVGRNGAGKSTLLRLLAGRIEADGGERTLNSGTRIVFVPQEPEITGETLLDYATSGRAQAYEAESQLEYFDLDPAKSTSGLSGGEMRRAALARGFAEAPDILLLDEPTNHLDILAIEKLEARIKASRAAVLTISHDRAFLERVTRTCFWLEHRKIRRLDEGFAAFDAWSRKLSEEEAENYRRLTKAIERETYTFYRSITAQRTRNEGRARLLNQMRAERALRKADQVRSLDLTMETSAGGGKLVAEVKGISKAFGERTLLKGFTTRILRGDRVAIVGGNGAGKSTLVKLLLGTLAPDSGTVRLGTNLEIAYLDQARSDLKPGTWLKDALAPGGGDQVMVAGQPMHVNAYAKAFLFTEAQLRQPVESLSGGERNRLLLARTLARPANLLVLDEPTNDLDMDTLDLLEDMLADYDGTLILVSHDRDFIDRLASSTIALDGRGNVIETPGGWADLTSQNPGFFDAPTTAGATAAKPVVAAGPAAKAVKLSYKDQRRLEDLEKLIDAAPGKVAALEARLADPALYAKNPAEFNKVSAQLDALRAQSEAQEMEWLELAAKREALGA